MAGIPSVLADLDASQAPTCHGSCRHPPKLSFCLKHVENTKRAFQAAIYLLSVFYARGRCHLSLSALCVYVLQLQPLI